MKHPQTTEDNISRLTRKIGKIGNNKELPPMVSTILILRYLGELDTLEASRGTTVILQTIGRKTALEGFV